MQAADRQPTIHQVEARRQAAIIVQAAMYILPGHRRHPTGRLQWVLPVRHRPQVPVRHRLQVPGHHRLHQPEKVLQPVHRALPPAVRADLTAHRLLVPVRREASAMAAAVLLRVPGSPHSSQTTTALPAQLLQEAVVAAITITITTTAAVTTVALRVRLHQATAVTTAAVLRVLLQEAQAPAVLRRAAVQGEVADNCRIANR